MNRIIHEEWSSIPFESEWVKINISLYWSSGIGNIVDHQLAQILLHPQPLKPSWKSFCWMPVHWESVHIQEESWCSGQCCHGWQGPKSCTLLHRMHISVPILQIAGCEWPVLVPGPRRQTIPNRVVPPGVLLDWRHVLTATIYQTLRLLNIYIYIYICIYIYVYVCVRVCMHTCSIAIICKRFFILLCA